MRWDRINETNGTEQRLFKSPGNDTLAETLIIEGLLSLALSSRGGEGKASQVHGPNAGDVRKNCK